MSYFMNSVEIHDDTKVITNPENKLIVNNNCLQLGRKYLLLRTIWNWVKGLFK